MGWYNQAGRWGGNRLLLSLNRLGAALGAGNESPSEGKLALHRGRAGAALRA
jgi:hypothetical protein